ncbi:MAG: hypothetical protein M0010_09250 [Actinomycetota bacterium]|jgi:hypothetical protein|nr:hypothetical protein [Actinomycetota bacterium]
MTAGASGSGSSLFKHLERLLDRARPYMSSFLVLDGIAKPPSGQLFKHVSSDYLYNSLDLGCAASDNKVISPHHGVQA